MPFARPAFRRLIRLHAEPVTVKRRDDTTSSNYGEEYTYSTLGSTRDIFIVGVEESQQPTEAGEKQAQRLTAYSEDTVDLQVNDRIDYNGEWFEVLSKEGKPTDIDPALYRYEFDNV